MMIIASLAFVPAQWLRALWPHESTLRKHRANDAQQAAAAVTSGGTAQPAPQREKSRKNGKTVPAAGK
jgi:hypothetical protein